MLLDCHGAGGLTASVSRLHRDDSGAGLVRRHLTVSGDGRDSRVARRPGHALVSGVGRKHRDGEGF